MNTSAPHPAAPAAACCSGHHGKGEATPAAPPVSHARLTTAATLHCLTGCAVGEWLGLAIGVTLGWGAWPTMALATGLAFVSGFTLGLWPLVKQGMGWGQALRTIWLGEVISISVMELVMNFTDYHVGGVTAASVFTLQFWGGFALALLAGFVAAWPVNAWLLRRQIKKPCH